MVIVTVIFAVIFIVSMLTAKPDEGMTKIFDEVSAECRKTAKHIGKGFAVKTGIVAAALFFIGLAVSVSRLGECCCQIDIGDLLVAGGAPMVAAFIAVFIGGFFVTLFGYGLSRSNDSLAQLAGYLVLFAGIFMMLAGLISNQYDMHFIARNSALIIGVIALVIILARDLLKMKTFSVGLTTVVFVAFIALWAVGTLELTVAVALGLMGCLTVQAFKQIGEDY